MSGDVISVSVVTPEGKNRNVNCAYVSLPCETGPIGILANHAPLLCSLSQGTVLCRKASGDEVNIDIPAGIAQVLNNMVTVLVS